MRRVRKISTHKTLESIRDDESPDKLKLQNNDDEDDDDDDCDDDDDVFYDEVDDAEWRSCYENRYVELPTTPNKSSTLLMILDSNGRYVEPRDLWNGDVLLRICENVEQVKYLYFNRGPSIYYVRKKLKF